MEWLSVILKKSITILTTAIVLSPSDLALYQRERESSHSLDSVRSQSRTHPEKSSVTIMRKSAKTGGFSDPPKNYNIQELELLV
jgi:hypothetical protein